MKFAPVGKYCVTVSETPSEGVIREELWVPEGEPNVAVKIETTTDGRTLIARLKNGLLHCEEEPAEVTLDADGRVVQEDWYINDIPHRAGGPATVTYHIGTNLEESISFWESGQLHSEVGPAVIQYSLNGDVVHSAFYVRGEEIEPFQFDTNDYTL